MAWAGEACVERRGEACVEKVTKERERERERESVEQEGRVLYLVVLFCCW